MKETFETKRFSPERQAMIALINDILIEYERLGYDLSLRQLYYQLVARGHIENSERSYKNTGSLVSDARLAGLIDWDMIKDRGRVQVRPPHWSSPADILKSAADSYRTDKWAEQPNRVIVLVEKQALEGVLIPVCRALDVSFMANKGYSSSSAMYELGKELRRWALRGDQNPHVLYLGDHDPSGIDMTRDVDERLNMFAGTQVFIHRLALNYDQIEQLNPPENPAKETDARFAAYVQRFGESSWELDAIEPRALAALVTEAVEGLRDEWAWQEAVEDENRERLHLARLAADYRSAHGNGTDDEN